MKPFNHSETLSSFSFFRRATIAPLLASAMLVGCSADNKSAQPTTTTLSGRGEVGDVGGADNPRTAFINLSMGVSAMCMPPESEVIETGETVWGHTVEGIEPKDGRIANWKWAAQKEYLLAKGIDPDDVLAGQARPILDDCIFQEPITDNGAYAQHYEETGVTTYYDVNHNPMGCTPDNACEQMLTGL